MIIGIVSDLHRHLPHEVCEALRTSDVILCAGDIEIESILWELQTIAPVRAVLGNNDHSIQLPFSATHTFEGVTIMMVHRPEDIGTIDPDQIDVVIHGHTHRVRNEIIDGVHYINPGSPTYPRGGNEPSVARLIIRDGHVERVEIISIGPWEKMPPRNRTSFAS